MGWFSKAVPQRKWTKVGAALGWTLRSSADSWYSTFREGTASRGFVVGQSALSETAKRYISILQLKAVAPTLQENAYVSDVMFFVEMLYSLLTGKIPTQFHKDIETMPFAVEVNPKRALTLWATAMARELSPTKDDSKLIEELTRYGGALVIQSQIATCEACGDPKGADKLRTAFLA